jgi:hypothetical protein
MRRFGLSPRCSAVAAVAALALCAPAAHAEVVAKGPVRLSVTGRLAPKALPRVGAAPVSVTLAGRIFPTRRGPAPQLRRIAFAINAAGRLALGALPVCRIGHIQPATNSEAMEACGPSLVGRGHLAADVRLPEQSPFPSQGKMLAFNGRLRGKPAILAHIYGTTPASTSYTLPFLIKRTRGTYGTLLEAGLPQISGEWGQITEMSMTLGKGPTAAAGQGYLSAGCPAPAGFPGAVFPLARTSFEFAGGLSLSATLDRSCEVAG